MQPPAESKEILDYGRVPFVPSAAAPPRSKLLDTETARIVFHADEDGVGRPPSAQTNFARACGLAPKASLSPDRLKGGRRAGMDGLGRAKASSVVAETVFGQTAADGFMNPANLQANFTIGKDGDFAKGNRFCVEGNPGMM